MTLPSNFLPPERSEWLGYTQHDGFWKMSYFNRLQKLVTSAEEARQAGKHDLVQALAQAWLFQDKYLHLENDLVAHLRIGESDYSHQDPLGLFAVAMLGLARIVVVDANTRYANLDPTKKQQNETEYHQLLARVDGIYQHFGVYHHNVLPQTIHGNPISWTGEIGQDKVNSLYRQGEIDAARKLAQSLHNQLTDNIVQAQNANNQEAALAHSSALSVVDWRLARINNDLKIMTQALNRSLRTHWRNHNFQRLTDLAQMSLKFLKESGRQNSNPAAQLRLVFWAGTGLLAAKLGKSINR